MTFDPNKTSAKDSGVFGLPYSEAESDIAILSVPWEATTSYGTGASLGPKLIYDSSKQMDHFDLEFGLLSEKKIFMEPTVKERFEDHLKLKIKAQKIITTLEQGKSLTPELAKIQEEINNYSQKLNEQVLWRAQKHLHKGRKVGLVGGDHSSPLGLMQAIGEKFPNWTLLHIDAHFDLRKAYQGFTHSHASIIYNLMESPYAPNNVITMGIRDFCPEEYDYYRSHKQIHCYFDRDLKKRAQLGENWYQICGEIIGKIAGPLYISMDIDGLNPFFCPNTGTPVPGGIDFDDMCTLLFLIRENKKTLVGFDLCEVSTGNTEWKNYLDSWDGNVGARMLAKLCGLLAST